MDESFETQNDSKDIHKFYRFEPGYSYKKRILVEKNCALLIVNRDGILRDFPNGNNLKI